MDSATEVASATEAAPAATVALATATADAPLASETAQAAPPLPSTTPVAFPSPTALPSASAAPLATPLPLALQLSVFEDLWQTVNDTYLYPDFNGLDWNAIHAEYRARIEAGLSNADYYAALAEMVDRLGDDHSAYVSPEDAAAEDAAYAGDVDYVGIGVYLSAVPERQRAVILAVFAGSPAEQAGLQMHDSILTVDGQPILDADGFLQPLIRGPEGSSLAMEVQNPAGETRQVTLTRQHITSPLPIPYEVLISPAGQRIGYLMLLTFSDSTVDERVGDLLREMNAAAPLDGLIIDNRNNEGGAGDVLEGVLTYFTSGILGDFISRQEERPLRIRRSGDVEGSKTVPLVVLVGKDTVSYGEVFCGTLKDNGRAYLIGETSDGNVETLWRYDFEDGSRAWIANESFRPRNHPEQNWEQTGIIPDQAVPAPWDLYTTQTDPAVLAALDHFDQ